MKKVLSAADRGKLVMLLGMLGSAFDGERANAASLADKLVRAYGLTWDDLIVPAVSRQSPPQYVWRDAIAECRKLPELLNQWERDFLASLSTRRGQLTPKQEEKLVAIAMRLGVEFAA